MRMAIGTVRDLIRATATLIAFPGTLISSPIPLIEVQTTLIAMPGDLIRAAVALIAVP